MFVMFQRFLKISDEFRHIPHDKPKNKRSPKAPGGGGIGGVVRFTS